MYFKLKWDPKKKVGAGNHSQKDENGNVVIYKSKEGKIIKSDIDLVEKFPTKFIRVDIEQKTDAKTLEKQAKIDADTFLKPPAGKKTNVQKAAEKGAEGLKPKKKKTKTLGKDITKKFEVAEESGLKVFYKKGKGYSVTEADEPDFLLSEKPIRKKADVISFIEAYVEEDEEEEEE